MSVFVSEYSFKNKSLDGYSDVLDSSRADADGEVQLSGGTREFTRIEPHVLIFHRCGVTEDQVNSSSYIVHNPLITITELRHARAHSRAATVRQRTRAQSRHIEP